MSVDMSGLQMHLWSRAALILPEMLWARASPQASGHKPDAMQQGELNSMA